MTDEAIIHMLEAGFRNHFMLIANSYDLAQCLEFLDDWRMQQKSGPCDRLFA